MAADVRVRLSAEGLAEVLSAFRRIASESERTSRGVDRISRSFTSGLAGARTLVAQLVGALTVGAFVGFTKSAADSADELVRVADTTGLTVSQFTALRAVAAQDDVTVEQLRRSLVHFRSTMADVQDGSGKGAQALKTLGVSVDELEGKSGAQQLELVARGLFQVSDRGKGADAIVELLGERVAVLVPALRRLGEEGFTKLIEDGERLGIIFDERLDRAAGSFGDKVDELGGQVGRLSTRFVGGFAPPMIAALTDIESELGRNASKWEEWGQRIGKIAGLAVIAIEGAADRLISAARRITIQVSAIVQAVDDPTNVLKISDKANRDVAELDRQFEQRFRDRLKRLAAIQSTTLEDVSGTKTRSEQEDEDRRRDQITTERIERTRAAIQNELQLTQAKLKAESESNEQALEQSLVSLAGYYAERRRIQQAGLAAEIAALEKRRAVELQEPDARKSAKGVADVDAQIARKNIEGKAADVALTFQQQQAEERLRKDRLKFESEIQRARGEEHARRMVEIAEETEARRKQLILEGETEERASSRSQEDRAILVVAEDFAESNRVAVREMQSFNAQRDEVQRRVSAGLLSQVEGERQILDIERERIVRLQEIAAQMTATAQASGSAEAIEQARQFAASVDEIALSIQRTENTSRRLGATLLDTGVNGVQGLFSALRRGATDGVSVIQQWAAGVVDSIAQVIEQMIALQLVSAALSFGGGAAGGIGGGGGAIGVPGITGRRQFPGPAFARGGQVHGPGTGTSDSIIARLSHEEYVTKASRARRSDVRSVLDILNFGSEEQVRELLADVHLGMQPFVFRPTAELIGFAAGGPVDAGVAGAALDRESWEGRLMLDVSPDLVPRYLRSRGGKKLIVSAITEKPRGVGRALGLRD